MTEAMLSWLYVSSSRSSAFEAPDVLTHIVSLARSRNATLDITGALIFTGTRFAQIVEGPVNSIKALQESIRADMRHENVRTLEEKGVKARRFLDWRLAYAGPSRYIANHLEKAIELADAGSADGVRSIANLLQAFTR